MSWRALASYGEVVGFLVAWVVGMAALGQGQRPTATEATPDQVASVDSVPPTATR